MPEVTAQMVKELRDMTGAGFMDCKKALEDSEGNFEKAIDALRIKGLAKAAKKLGKETPEGIITSYIHAGRKIGVMVEVNCETDFVARNEEFRNLSKEIAMQIAATSPSYINQEDVPEEALEKELEILRAQVRDSGRPENIVERIVQGKIDKFFEEVCLLEQPYIRDPKLKVRDLISSAISKLGENIVIRRFARYQVGEPLEDNA